MMMMEVGEGDGGGGRAWAMAIMALEDLYVCLRTVEPSGGGVRGVERGEGGVRGGAVIECSIAKMMTVERDWETKTFVMILQGMCSL